MEEREEESIDYVSKELRTMLPADVHKSLTVYAQIVSKTGLGKWDYGVAIRSLLEKAELYEVMVEILARLDKLEKKKDGVKTFGGDINGK